MLLATFGAGDQPGGRARTVMMAGLLACLAISRAAGDTADVFELSLQELLQIEVTSASRRSQPLSKTAAAVFVITREDIQRSGVTSLPDALRLAPGVQVASIDGNKWAITSRGFNALYANKLLVLIDGRTVYSPLFAGTFWDSQDTVLRDVERIEVVRGPGATLWGSNAVNGVVNIITRSAAETVGSYGAVLAGNQERGTAEFRQGVDLAERGALRLYAKWLARDANEWVEVDRRADDVARQARLGFRADLTPSPSDTLSLQGDWFSGRSGENAGGRLVALVDSTLDTGPSHTGFNALGRWNHEGDEGGELSVQAYFDHYRRKWKSLSFNRSISDLDVDYRMPRIDRHDVLLGFGYRRIEDDAIPTDLIEVVPTARRDKLLSAFIQDDIELQSDRWYLTLGLKVERNDYSGAEYLPNARLLWTPVEQGSVWASVTRSVRIPGRADQDSRILVDVLPAEGLSPVPAFVYINGNRDFDSEYVLAYEIGGRYAWNTQLSVDVAAFYSDYDDLRLVSLGSIGCEPDGPFPVCLGAENIENLVVNGELSNDLSAGTHGAELVANWRPTPRWQLQSTYSFLKQNFDGPSTMRTIVSPIGVDPRHQASLRIGYQPAASITTDLWLRYTDELDYGETVIDAYTSVSARLAWKPTQGMELAIVGHHLQRDEQIQFESETGQVPLTGLKRSVFLQLSWTF